MESSLINQGLTLMLYGMGTVFVFLTILVFATRVMSAVANRFAAAEPAAVAAPRPANTSGQSPSSEKTQANPAVIRAIEKAIAAHRAKK